MRFVSRRAALLRGGSSKENWTKERVCERREAHGREPRRVSRRSSHAAERLRTSRNLFVVYEICASLDNYWGAPVLSFAFARSPKSLGAKDHRQDSIFVPRKSVCDREFRHDTSLDSLSRSSLRSPTSAREISCRYSQEWKNIFDILPLNLFH